MESQVNERIEEQTASETPEDVAILYSWANLHGARYRDYSASRRERRAQLRHRAAEEVRETELRAQAESEAAAAVAERAAREAEKDAANAHTEDAFSRERALSAAQEAARQAAAERLEASQHAEAAANADAAARLAEREMADAQVSARRQAARYADSDSRRQHLAGPQPVAAAIPGRTTDPYTAPPVPAGDRITGALPVAPAPATTAYRQRQGFRPDEASGYRPVYRASASPESVPYNPPLGREIRERAQQLPLPVAPPRPQTENPAGPAWLYATQTGQSAVRPRTSPIPAAVSATDTLQQSRERVAARWYALKGVFDHSGERPAEPPPIRDKEIRPPVVAIFSLAGGVGKTSLVATLGRALSSLGERVLLSDTTSHGLLPFYFGASELRSGVVRTFSPPSGSMDAPISLVSYDVEEAAATAESQSQLIEQVLQNGRGSHRVVVDLSGSSAWVLRQMAKSGPNVLIPVAPDMNSVISLQAVEKIFHNLTDAEGRAIQPRYLLNHFDASLPLHLDVREVLRRQLGDRLLPFVIRRAPAVSEALAEGMTVVDYAPESAIVEDYLNVAVWLRKMSAPIVSGFRNVRWSER